MGIKGPGKYTATCIDCKENWNVDEPQNTGRCKRCGSLNVDIEERPPRKAATIRVKVILDDGDFKECTFEGSVEVNSDWMKDFSQAKEISDAICTAFLKTTEGKERQAYKEYDATFQCGLCGQGPTVAVKKHYHVCESCRHGIDLHGIEEWILALDRERG